MQQRILQNSLVIIVISIMATTLSLAQEKPSSSISSIGQEKEIIKQVIIDETTHFYNGDYESWSKSFVHSPNLFWAVTPTDNPGESMTLLGWSNISVALKVGWFDLMSKEDLEAAKNFKRTRDKWIIEVRDHVAWVSFTQTDKNEVNKTTASSTETRVLEKIDGHWKLVQQSTIVDFKNASPPIKSKY